MSYALIPLAFTPFLWVWAELWGEDGVLTNRVAKTNSERDGATTAGFTDPAASARPSSQTVQTSTHNFEPAVKDASPDSLQHHYPTRQVACSRQVECSKQVECSRQVECARQVERARQVEFPPEPELQPFYPPSQRSRVSKRPILFTEPTYQTYYPPFMSVDSNPYGEMLFPTPSRHNSASQTSTQVWVETPPPMPIKYTFILDPPSRMINYEVHRVR
mmetsp:Transcript_4218/g.8700  ORF Transcript_4218/g.8700 Transcript_4218/m.8700 type:complete len:218 (+) Transcript_4218:194-847(+)